ncbi:MAG: hypothetical protein NWF04_10460 [Candidatus Bathyarchaeota archaeon]|nr:hypothetical protein [Candidatus Bathyarchaeota archaeon]
MDTSLFIPILFLLLFGVVMFLSLVASMKQKKSWNQQPYQSSTNPQNSQYNQPPTAPRYVTSPDGFSDQMELDIRLPYRQFKLLHPESNLDYERYKQMQMQKAFKRSISSQQNKRMVR